MSDRKDILKNTMIIYDSVSYFVPLLKLKGLTVFNSFRNIPNLFRLLRLFSFFHLPLKFFYGEWISKVGKYEVLILFESRFIISLINYIHKKYPEKRLIVWYWNPVVRSTNPKMLPDSICEKWSFDPVDCQNYAMRSNTTFYFDSIILPKKDIRFDVFFIGIDKGRRVLIRQLETALKKLGLKVLFYIVDDRRFRSYFDKKYPSLSYQQTLRYISESHAILDILPEGQSGISVRAMESIFFSKKLLTNNAKIIEIDFYHPDNVFVLNVDDLSNLPAFLNRPYHCLPEPVIAKYDAGSWLDRFFA